MQEKVYILVVFGDSVCLLSFLYSLTLISFVSMSGLRNTLIDLLKFDQNIPTVNDERLFILLLKTSKYKSVLLNIYKRT